MPSDAETVAASDSRQSIDERALAATIAAAMRQRHLLRRKRLPFETAIHRGREEKERVIDNSVPLAHSLCPPTATTFPLPVSYLRPCAPGLEF